MNKDIFKLERDRIFNAALMLVREGRYYTASLAEIAYHAGLSEMTTRILFGSKDNLTSELIFYAEDFSRDAILD
jgi:AcrR family transcriptional regulator